MVRMYLPVFVMIAFLSIYAFYIMKYLNPMGSIHLGCSAQQLSDYEPLIIAQHFREEEKM